MAPLVSVIVTCFNQCNYLERSVNSVISQTFADLECIIIDDGSQDNTKNVAENLVNLDSRVSYFYKENGGVSSARNFGFKQAKGKWIQFLDGDDWINEDKIRFQLSHLNETKLENLEDIVLYANYERVFFDSQGEITKRQENIVGDLTKNQLIERLLIPDFLADSPFPLLQQCLLMNRNIFQKKIFDEQLKALQDRDFTLDILLTETNFVYTPIIGAYYTKHKSNRTNNWSYMKDYYILLYETVCKKHPQLIPLSKIGVDFLIKEAIREKNKDHFHRLLKLVDYPLGLSKNIKIRNKTMLNVAFAMRLIIPDFILYEKYRGPRSHKVIAIFDKIISLLKPANSNCTQ